MDFRLFESTSATTFKSINDVYNYVQDEIKNDKTLNTKIQKNFVGFTSQLFRSALNNQDGYCIKYQLPISGVNAFYTMLKLDPTEVEKAFRADWKYPSANTHMVRHVSN